MAGRIFTIAQQKGGSGKTTLAAHLGVVVARTGCPVALLDTDPQGSLGAWFELREQLLGEGHTGLSFRTASGWGARREARSLARDHAFVFIDTPPKSDLDARPAIEAAERVVVPVQPSPVDVWATQAVLEIAARERVPAVMVLNRVPPRGAVTEEVVAVLKTLPVPVATARIGGRVGFAAAMGEGRTVTELEPGSKSAAEIDALARELFG